MRYNKILAVTIASALSLSTGLAYANLDLATTGATFASGDSFQAVPSADGVTVATEMFGSSGNSLVLPTSGAESLIAAVYTVPDPGDLSIDVNLKLSLDNGAKFSSDPVVEVDCTVVNACTTNAVYAATKLATGGGGSGESTATFLVPASGNNELDAGDTITIAFNVTNAGVLATAGEKIQLTAELVHPIEAYRVLTPGTTTVFESADGLDINITPELQGEAKISVTSGMKEFTGDSTAPSAYIDSTRVVLGSLKVANVSSSIFGADLGGGVSPPVPWQIGFNTAVVNNSTPALSTLVITGGQFAGAQTGGTGKVYLEEGNIEADSVVDDVATWNLDDSDFSTISAANAGLINEGVTRIILQTDGATPINTTENNPQATLTINFSNDNYQDNYQELIEGPQDLRKFYPDGTVCWVYNVPKPDAADILIVRITNDTSIAGDLKGSLYKADGSPLTDQPFDLLEGITDQPAVSNNQLRGHATVRINSEQIEAAAMAAGASGTSPLWSARATMRIDSTIPGLEVLSLLRQRGVADAPLTNLSTGADGVSCTE